jgi:hypothetical protein
MSVTLFVGFGGSGGKCLEEMAKLIADDHELLEESERRHCFLLVDTDRGELEKAKENIETQLKRVKGGDPVVVAIDLAANVDFASKLVESQIGKHVEASNDQGTETPGLRALLDHWHFRRVNSRYEAFDARKLPRALKDGAGQCPAVGHLAMWHKLPELNEALDDLFGRIRNRFNEAPQLDVMLVGSLAGGTGRGCWQLLSLCVKGFFEERSISVKPLGFFMEASCFREKVDSAFHWRLDVNTLTGVSEIVAYLRNSRSEPAAIRVPHLKDPTSSQPAIDTGSWLRATQTPISSAYLFSRDSDAAAFNLKDMYGQVGRALYVGSRGPILSLQANEAVEFAGTGAGIASVPITMIRDTVRLHARKAALDHLLASDPERCAEAKGKAATLVRDISFKVSPLPTENGWSDDADGLVGRCEREYKQALDLTPVSDALNENQDIDAVCEAAAAILQNGDSDLAARVVHDQLAKATEAGFVRSLSALIRECLHSSDSPLGQADAFAGECKRRVDALCDAAFKAREQSPKSRTQDFRDYLKDRAGRVVPVIGRRWSDNEISEIEGALRGYSWDAARRRVFKEIGDRLSCLDARIERMVAAIAAARGAVEAVRTELAERAEELQAKCFLPVDNDGSDGLSAHVLHWEATRHKLNRQLRPMLVPADLANLAEAARKSNAFAAAQVVLMERILGFTEGALEGKGDSRAKQQLAEPIQSMVSRADISQAELRRRFAVLPVLESMELRFREYLNAIHGDHAETDRTQAYLESFFGRRFIMATDGREYAQIPVDELFNSLCLSLAQVTDPMLHVPSEATGGGNTPDSVTVLVPLEITEDQCQAAEKYSVGGGNTERQDGQRVRMKLREVGKYRVTNDQSLQFGILTFTQRAIALGDADPKKDPFDGLANLREWSTNPTVRTWLRRCEGDRFAADGSYWINEDNSFGIGYVMPLMLTQPWASLRWSPWIGGDEVGQHRRRVLDAVLYALIGNMDESMLADQQKFLVDARTVLGLCAAVRPSDGRTDSWTMPLLRRDEDGIWRFTRRSFVRERNEVIAAGYAWQQGRSFSTLREMIKQLGLRPDGSTQEGQQFLRAIEAERRLVQGTLLSKLEDAGPARREQLNQALVIFLENYERNYLSKRQEEQRSIEGPFLEELRARISQGASAFKWDSFAEP